MNLLEKITKVKSLNGVSSNLSNYDDVCASFNWSDVDREFSETPSLRGEFSTNMAWRAVDRHVAGGRGACIAIRCLPAVGGGIRDISFLELMELTNRFANLLNALGVAPGDVVSTLLGRIPELYTACLGALKHRSVCCPLFSAFGPEPIKTRLALSKAKILVTTSKLYERKVAGIRAELPDLKHVLLVDGCAAVPATEGVHSFGLLMGNAAPTYLVPVTHREDPALLHFTSGTTGAPKGALHVHQAALVHYITGRYVLDLRPGDIFWCTADPGWVTGTSYGIIAPLVIGATLVVDEGEFDAGRWYQILQEQNIAVWYTAPTAIRMLMKSGDDLPRAYNLSSLRHIVSVGEPLNAKAVIWGERCLGHPIHDTWWQTETGGIMIANFPSMDIKPGSMGRPVPGVDAAIVHVEGGHVRSVGAANEEGELAIRTGWPSMFRTYLNQEERYRKCFIDDFYLTGDLARRDEDGYFWFVGRSDDVIKSAGHLIGPFEVESALMEHASVAEAAVIGKPDELLLEVTKAFVALKPGYVADEALRRDIMAFARKRLGPAVAPREIEFVGDLPKTKSGKIMRRLLKSRDLGLPEGDTSTLEQPYTGGLK